MTPLLQAGNVARVTTVFGSDLFYARHLRKNNFVLWATPTDRSYSILYPLASSL